jgi:prolyl-tRNA synthetase
MWKLIPRSENYSEWYNQLVQDAWLAENSSVRWCMVIKPYGYAIWENIKNILDAMFKNTGHTNAYFPLFIPKSFLSKEADHVEHFAKECAIVTHYRLKVDENKKLIVDPEAKLEEELIVRPTSETIIRDSYKKRINSYRDLPILVNQWANIVRREMRTRIFLRTAEFLRQEWHTAHATYEEAEEEARKMHKVYNDFATHFMAISPVLGPKPEHDKFAWALTTYAVEPMMQDFKALQAGTSHNLGQNFGKVFDVKFTNKDNKLDYVRGTSRGVSTRLIWGLIMSHSDDQGLVLPPAIAPIHVIIVPIFKTEEELTIIKDYLKPIIDTLSTTKLKLQSEYFNDEIKISYKIDDDKQRSMGWKFNERELKGVPVRIAVWPRDVESGKVELFRRDTGNKESVSINEAADKIIPLLHEIQKNLFEKNQNFRTNNTYYVESYEEFKEKINKWFVMAHRDGDIETALRIQEETKATIRCIPFSEFLEDDFKGEGKCIVSGNPSKQRVLFAKSY